MPLPALEGSVFDTAPSEVTDVKCALLNILDDFASEQYQLRDMQTAVLNILEDSWLERGHSRETQRAVLNILDDFAEETKQELFPTADACIEFYTREENFAKLLRSEVGDNLIHKYRAMASFYFWPEACACVMEATLDLLQEAGVPAKWPGFETLWNDFHRFIQYRHAWGRNRDAILSTINCVFDYDIAEWLSAGCPENTEPFRMPGQEFEFRLSAESAQDLEEAFEMWTDSLSGLTKMVARLKVGRQNRDQHAVCGVGA